MNSHLYVGPAINCALARLRGIRKLHDRIGFGYWISHSALGVGDLSRCPFWQTNDHPGGNWTTYSLEE